MQNKKLKRIAAMITAVTIVLNGNILIKSVHGEETDRTAVVEIATEEDLKNISNDLDGNYKLTNDIALSDDMWTSIRIFSGTFDGAGYTISNLHSDGQGLFSVLEKTAVIKNLTISGEAIANGRDGALLAESNHGTIINCITEETVKQTERVETTYSLSGMVLFNAGYMEQCINKADVMHLYDERSTTMDLSSVGGVVSSQYGTMLECKNEGTIISDCWKTGGVAGTNQSMMDNCVNSGAVTAKYDVTGCALHIGGIVGSNYGFTYRSLNQGAITALAENTPYSIGGISGESSGYSEILECENLGTISGSVGNIGGICGSTDLSSGTFSENGEFVVSSGEVVISNCVNSGIITTSVNAVAHLGGVLGNIKTLGGKITVLDSINHGMVCCYETMNGYCGGLVGLIHSGENGIVELKNLSNDGIVTSEYGKSGGIYYLGEADGEHPIILKNCVNAGNISGEEAYGIGYGVGFASNCYNAGPVSATRYACGIAVSVTGPIENCYNLGEISGGFAHGITWKVSENGSIKNVYNVGVINGEIEEYGLLPASEENLQRDITNSYYLSKEFKTAEQFGTAVSQEALVKKETYVGFDFDITWEMKVQNEVLLPALKNTEILSKVTLETDTLELKIGEKVDLKSSEGRIVDFQSVNPLVASVEQDGTITAKGAGTTSVYAISDDGQIATCLVTVLNFTIQPIKLTSVSLATTAYTYNGYAKKPTVTVKAGTKKLVNGTDYIVTYVNNINPGVATVTVIGTGNYTGTIAKTFTINLPKVSNFKQSTTYATNKITMSWNKVKGATGYAIYRASTKNGSYKYLKSVTTNTTSHVGLKAGSKYYYKVRAYKTVNGKKVYGAYSDAKSMLTKPGVPTSFSVTLKSRTAKISWAKSAGAQGFEVYMSNSRNGSYTRIKSTSATSTTCTKTGLVKGKRYYFKMRAYTKTGSGAKVYSGYSKIKAVTVSK